MRVYRHYLMLLAAAILLASQAKALSLSTGSSQTKLASVASPGTLQLDNAVLTRGDGERLLRVHKTDDESNKIGNYNTDSEERGFQSTAKSASAKLAKKLATKWKTVTNKDFRNLNLFLNEQATFEELYKKGATPFKLFTEMDHNGIAKVGKIDVSQSMLTPDKLSSSFLFLRSLRSSVTPTPFSGASARPIPGARPLTLRPRVLQVPTKKNNIPGFSASDSSFVGFVRSCTSAARSPSSLGSADLSS
ncbi:hypothetical protein PI125_g9055 [Phytophthora idaei]|nr:hypothetical protein PI125_g9055 [Phytophthora idaei]KAG3155583.1 hypothetical protein PI126_g9096 [Phytophthora idaei]